MKFSTLALSLFAAGMAAADYIRCADKLPSPEHMDAMNIAAANHTMSIEAVRNVKTYVHVVTTSAKKGKYSQAMVNKQIQVMNDAYTDIGATFVLQSTDFTVNDAWAKASDGSAEEKAMKQALKKGTYADLNLYLLSDLGGGLLGFCYFPLSSPSSNDKLLDGCICLAGSMPDAEVTNYNMGLTAVHEVGHWFGLYHVFQYQSSPCNDQGDYVSDTPQQKTATSGCPSSQDSCPSQPGVDSIHNYMDYSYDACMYQFTSGQASRAGSLYDQYRAGK